MEQIRQALAAIKAQAGRLTPTQKMLMASLAVLLAMTMFLVTQYAGRRELVELMPGAAPEGAAQAVEFLRASNIEHAVREGRPFVAPDRKYAVLAQMTQQGRLPSETTLMFDALAEGQSWMLSADQRRQNYLLALQNELAAVIGEMDGVRKAAVIIDSPPPGGLGMSARKATASAVVFSYSGPLRQNAVDAIAGLIAGAVSGLDIADVRVIDGATNRQLRARTEDGLVASDYLELLEKYEERFRQKLLDALVYIPGVIVAVNAQVDVRRTQLSETRYMPSGEGTVGLLSREGSTERNQSQSPSGAEPGVRPNTGADLTRGGGRAEQFTESESDGEFENRFGETSTQTFDPRGMPTRVNATVNVPRSYFVERWRRAQPSAVGAEAEGDAAAPEPTEEQIQPLVQSEIDRIRAAVEPLVDTTSELGGTAGAVVVSMIPDAPGLIMGLSDPLGSGSSGGAGGLMDGAVSPGLVRNLALGALAVGALGVMAMILRKAGRRQALPSAEELVGIPPALRHNLDVFGEADEADANLTGVELTDTDVETRKKFEQVADLVRDKPQEAAFVLGRWIKQEE